MSKIDRAIETIRKAEPLALQYSEHGFRVAFSGGKDSQVIYELCKMAGVKFRAVMQVTTIDPPELMKFVRRVYPDVVLERPELNFYNLILKKKFLPNRHIRYCCQHLKEFSGAGTVTVLGIRRAESNKRAKRNEFEILGSKGPKYSNSLDQFNIDRKTIITCAGGKDKIVLSPIIDWSTSDVWNFIRGRGLEYCSLYNEGYHRIGCVFCPMATAKIKQLDRKRYPGIEKQIKKTIEKLIENGYGSRFNNVDEIFNWWISNRSVDECIADKQQLKIDI